MIRSYAYVCATFLLCLSWPRPGQANRSQPLKLKLSSNTDTSVQVTRVHDGKTLFSHQANRHLIPASVSKLPTALCSLELFGPFTSFKTPLLIDGKRAGTTIHGDLIIQGVGDPLLINEKLWQMAADLRHMGIRRINGDLIIDNSLFSDEARDRSRRFGQKRSSNAYDAPVTALAINFNTIPIAIYPNPEARGPALVNIDPYNLAHIKIANRLSTSKKATGSLQVSRMTRKGESTITLQGRLSARDSLKKVYRSAGQPTQLAGEQLRTFLQQAGIALSGQIRAQKTPASAQIIYEIEGFPVAKMIHGLNKYSNNFIADMLVKKLGASFGKGGSLKAGLEVISSCLNERLPPDPMRRLYTGSGLDPRNQQSAEDLVNLLLFAEKDIAIYPELMASLPISGIDGTLADRFKGSSLAQLRGKIRAKTGTLTSPVTVSSLAGYLHHPKHGLLAFAIIENGKAQRTQPSILDLRVQQEHFLLDLWQQL